MSHGLAGIMLMIYYEYELHIDSISAHTIQKVLCVYSSVKDRCLNVNVPDSSLYKEIDVTLHRILELFLYKERN